MASVSSSRRPRRAGRQAASRCWSPFASCRLFSFLVAGRLTARLGSGIVIAAGSTIFAAGVAWWASATGLTPDYAGEMLGGMILTGIGVGLTLPTMMATGASSLPRHSFATGSAVVNMLRQIGLAIGVAILIAIVGSPRSPAAVVGVYERASRVIVALSLVGAGVGLALLARPARPDEAQITTGTAAMATDGAGSN